MLLSFGVTREELDIEQTAVLVMDTLDEQGKKKIELMLKDGLMVESSFESKESAVDAADTLNLLDGSGEKYRIFYIPTASPGQLLEFLDKDTKTLHKSLMLELMNAQQETVKANPLVFLDEFGSYFNPTQSVASPSRPA